MAPVVKELDATLQTLEAAKARRLEQLVRDALLLAGEINPGTSPSDQWPQDYFDRTAGVLAGEEFEQPPQGKAEQRESW